MTMRKSLMVSGAVIGLLSSAPTLVAAQSREALSIADKEGIYIDGKSFKVARGTANGEASSLIENSGARDLGPAAIVFRKGDKLYLVTVAPDQKSYGSDRRDYGSDRRDYGSDRRDYGSDRRDYGSDRRDYGSDRRDYGSDRRDYATDRRNCDPLDSGNRQDCERRDYGSDRRDYGSDRRDYGSDRDENPSTAQSVREWREWLQSQRQSNNRRDYGSDRRDYGSDRRDYGSNRTATEFNPQGAHVNDPEYAQYRLKRFFDENWTASDTR
jgi:hypothetical protein